MKLIERTSPESLQTLLVTDQVEESINEVDIIKSNLFQRLLRHISSLGISGEEFENNLSPCLNLRVVKITKSCREDIPGRRSVLVGNINLPSFKEEEAPNQKVVEALKVGGVELPRKEIVGERLKELNFSEKDPFRLENVEYSVIEDLPLEGVSIKDLVPLSDTFYDFLYSGQEVTAGERLKATYILSVDKILSELSAEESSFTDPVIKDLVYNVDDMNLRRELFIEIKSFIDNPSSRKRKVEDAKRTLKHRVEGDTKVSNPIKTWKVVTACVILILGVLAYTRRDSIKAAFSIAKESKDLEKSKFSLFAKSLFSRTGRREARNYVNSTKGKKMNSEFLKEVPVLVKEAKASLSRDKYTINKAKSFFRGK